MQLIAATLPFVDSDSWKCLFALEKGQEQYEYVPKSLVARYARLRPEGLHKVLGHLMKYDLVVYERKPAYEGYRLTWNGFDYIALRAFIHSGIIESVGPRIGVGKEADVHIVSLKNKTFCLKIHRLGRTSFRSAKSKRGYLKPGEDKVNWLHMSCLSAETEFTYMKQLRGHGLPTPKPIDHNRHMIIMTFADGLILNKVKKLHKTVMEDLLQRLFQCLVDMLSLGLVHGDYNEFNLLVSVTRDRGSRQGTRMDHNEAETESIGIQDTLDLTKVKAKVDLTMIDFPQVVTVAHPHARELFERDVESIRSFFWKRFRYEINSEDLPSFDDIVTNDMIQHLALRTTSRVMYDQLMTQRRGDLDSDITSIDTANSQVQSSINSQVQSDSYDQETDEEADVEGICGASG
ncbi:RIO kinase family protein [Gregarina niphandrodes]|uniref:non-specific serine/threonine protein kinase n=1 Tax=Gregarina niphandrodes TaxID=110365 RepID=A0A023BDT1_GRENI|nr:RIO kinase family protein [Gregarina niphandrodes]EZG89094.1 RIO kinase family protein [Gregarina niphandrodes]|eukprot:XP_011128500.1 RIO kinase family protein [Gregarina niphandrodes]